MRSVKCVKPGLGLGRVLLASCLVSPAIWCLPAPAWGAPGCGESGFFSIDNRALNLSVQEIRVAQVLDDPYLPLVANRSTLVRVAVQWSAAQNQVAAVDGVLKVYVDGQLWRGPIQSTGAITARMPVDWIQDNSTINFIVAPPQSDNVDFEVELNPASLGSSRIPENDYTDNTARHDNLSFVCRKVMSIGYVAIDYRPTAPDSNPNYPPYNMIAPGQGDRFVRAIYPVPSVRYWYAGDLLWLFDVNNSGQDVAYVLGLKAHRLLQYPNIPDFLYAWLPGNPYSGNGLASLGGRVAFGNTDPSRHLRTFAHELGHNFGLNHNNSTADLLGVDVDNLLGLGRIHSPTQFDIMVPGLLTNQAWINEASYRSFFNAGALDCPSQSVLAHPPEADGNVLLVGGQYHPATMTATLEQVYELPPRPLTAPDPTGDLVMRAYHLDPAPVLLYELRLRSEPLECPEGDECGSVFAPTIPAVAGDPAQRVDRIDIVDALSGQLLAQHVRSSAAPQIGITNPADGQVLTEGMQITWTGSDEDGDSLQYALLYSWNNGQSWRPLAVNTSETSLLLKTEALPGSNLNSARLKLTATDGMNTVSVEVTGLTLDTKKPPDVHILGPLEGTLAQLGSPVALSASVSDLEDGEIPEAQIKWSSDVDGLIGTGGLLVVESLSLGVHELSVTAVDSDNMATSRSVTLEITDRARAIPADLDFDNDVDGGDFAIFEACTTGASISYDPNNLPPGCTLAAGGDGMIAPDFDGDNDVDMTDFAAFQRCISGEGVLADPACGE